MKRVIMLIVAFTGLTFMAGAQTTNNTQPATTGTATKKSITPEEQAENQTKHAAKQLSLTEEQKKQYYGFALERINTVHASREKIRATEDKEEKKKLHGESSAALTKFDNNVKGILTPEQLTKWEAIKAKKIERRKEKISDGQTRVIQDNNH